MRIKQGYVSKSVADLPLLKVHGLKPYKDPTKPAVFFGMYRDEDIKAYQNHKGMAVIRWCGQDALDFKQWSAIKFETHHITPLVKVIEHLNKQGINVRYIKPVWKGYTGGALPSGDKVYVYMPASAPQYHGKEWIDRLRKETPYEYLIGSGDVPHDRWVKSEADRIYTQCFAGVFLSKFAGGAGGCVEMGERGKPVITNTTVLPNAYAWSSIGHVITLLHEFYARPRTADHHMAKMVSDYLDKDFEFLNTSFYEL